MLSMKMIQKITFYKWHLAKCRKIYTLRGTPFKFTRMVLILITWLNWFFLFEGNVNSTAYINLLQESVIPRILKDFHDEHFYFQHYRCVTNYNDEILQGRWIWQKGSAHYTVCSSDLFLFWNFSRIKFILKRNQTVVEFRVPIEKNVIKYQIKWFSKFIMFKP